MLRLMILSLSICELNFRSYKNEYCLVGSMEARMDRHKESFGKVSVE